MMNETWHQLRLAICGLGYAVCLGLFLGLMSGCRGPIPKDEAAQTTAVTEQAAQDRFPMAEADHFAGMDGTPDPNGEFATRVTLSPSEIKGRNAWMLWCGGNEAFWDWLARNGYGTIDLLQVIDSAKRGDRFQRAGMVTEPGAVPPTEEETAEAYGVRYDRVRSDRPPNPDVYGYPSGIVGLRLFPNPEFKGLAVTRWDADRYYSDHRYATDPATIRPFRVGMSCAFCHAAPDPLRPPVDVENPKWSNLSGTIGNQYLRVREVLGNMLDKDNYLYHVIDSQFPGTIDTSLIASDNINNANTMNAVFNLGARVERTNHNPFEKLDLENELYPGVFQNLPTGVRLPDYNANPRPVPRVLVDGSDSVGAWLAFARVYLNIGTYHQQWVRVHNPVLGFREQEPFKLSDIESHSIYWKATKYRVDPMVSFFLKASSPMLLKDAPTSAVGDRKIIPTTQPWEDPHKLGRQVYAKGCIACHSSFQPGDNPELEKEIDGKLLDPIHKDDRRGLRLNSADIVRLTRGDGALPAEYLTWANAAVESQKFWENNYLSTDARIPVTLVQTNSARAAATNAMHGNVWEDFSSFTYKELKPVGPVRYFDPFADTDKEYSPPGGGPGYYRVPTLISLWATAPYLHNNSLGKFTNDPSVKGRHAAFQDGIRKLLWPETRYESHDRGTVGASDDIGADQLRADHGLIWRTPQSTTLTIYSHQIPGLLRGYTGWAEWLVKFLPWLPALISMALGMAFFFLDSIQAKWAKFMRWLARARPVIGFLHIASLLVIVGIFALVTYKIWQYWTAMAVVEATSGWVLPWIRLQALLIIVLFCFLIYLLGNQYLPGSDLLNHYHRWIAVGCLLLGFVFALGVGMFASGRGGDLKLGPFPKGMPVNLISNIDPKANHKDLVAAFEALLDYIRLYRSSDSSQEIGLHYFESEVAPAFMKVSKCPDFVLDRGHDYEVIHNLSAAEKEALIELLKTF